MKQYICSICGYVYEGAELPDDWNCPVCRAGKKAFLPKEEDCGYVYDDEKDCKCEKLP